MAAELNPIEISTIPELAHLADEVQRTRRPRRLRHNGKDVAVLMPATSPLDAGSQSIPALDPPRSWDEMTEIAAEEHAQHVAGEGSRVSKRRRGRPTSAADPLWAIIGTVESTGPTDVAEHVDRYLADAAAPPPR